jgi:cytochrome c oxidase cbb3-type subunit 1
MEKSMSLAPTAIESAVRHIGATRSEARAPDTPVDANRVFLHAAWHSLFWLVFANAVGVLIAGLLLVPQFNGWLGEWTYGRWMPVHLDLQLYGWSSLPLVAFLFKVYGANRVPASRWCRSVLWIWSTALAVGTWSWLHGHVSGKLFLDWMGYSRILFPLALLSLWTLLLYAMVKSRHAVESTSKLIATIAKVVGLLLLLAIPPILYIAANPDLYPPINPASGGPTGASQLESALIIVAILLLLPFGLTSTKRRRAWPMTIAWSVFAAEALLCLGLGRADVSNHRPTQYISLGSLLVWLPLLPAYYGCFAWHANTRRWRIAFLAWWSILIPTGWCLFLPGVLDRLKFTDGLVGHALLAMAGFTSSLLIFVLVQLLGIEGRIFNQSWSFYLWHASVLLYVVLMFVAGFREGYDPAFTILPGLERNTIYVARFFLGLLMWIASADWLYWATLAALQPAQAAAVQEVA